jgi:drug/metabolite transporter (DMT)-like permease
LTPLLSPLAALGSAAAFGIADFSGGLAGRRTPAPSVTVGIELCGLSMLPLAIWLLPSGWDARAASLAFTSGILGGLGLIAFYRAMAHNLIGVVAPITGVVAAALPTTVGLFEGDRLRALQLGGIGLGLVAIALISGARREPWAQARAGVILAIVAGVSFGLFFVLFHAASFAGVTAFISGRLGSGLAGLGVALVSGVPFIAGRRAWRLIAIGGVLDGGAVVLYLYASRNGLLSLTALLASFYPAFTVLCARLFTRERLTVVQAVGAAMAVVAVAMIASS